MASFKRRSQSESGKKIKRTKLMKPTISGQIAKLVLAFSLLAPLTAGAAVTVTASLAEPTVGADDLSYLPGLVNEGNTIAGGATSAVNDAWTYIANDRTSKAQSFTTGANIGGYSLNSISVQHLNWINFTTNGTFFNIQNGDTFDIRVGTLSGQPSPLSLPT
jgi:hypothetical protein